ncbi:MAG: DNA polymerase IV [Phycisphaerales bacterium]|nr:DNA polymerase IV [Phycisphaerales bacterium]
MSPRRTILHADMDAFYASVEQRDDAALRGRPVLVGGRGKRSVVCAASYEARAFGCRSAQPMAIALRRCPDAVVVRPRFDRYSTVSDEVFAVFERFTPLVQPLSIDEAFLDVTGSTRLFGDGPTIARAIRAEVRERTALTCSVGVAPNKFLAKLASDLEKPDGLTVIDEAWIQDRLPTMPIGRMWGVGPVTEERLRRVGIATFADLTAASPASLLRALGSEGESLQRLACGEDERAVETDGAAKSISCERTFGDDLEDRDEVRARLVEELEQVARRLRRSGRLARTVSLKIRLGDFRTISRSETLADPTDRTDALLAAATGLFGRWASTAFEPVRLIGVGVSELVDEGEQLGLFTAEGDQRRRRADDVADRIAERFGKGAIRRTGFAGEG